jgi:hypothetical protein
MANKITRSAKSPADAQEARIIRTKGQYPKYGKLAIGTHAIVKKGILGWEEQPYKQDMPAVIRGGVKAFSEKKTGIHLNLKPMKRNKDNGIPYQDHDMNLKELTYETRAKIKTAARKAKKSISSPE